MDSTRSSRSKTSSNSALYSQLAKRIVSDSVHLKQGDSVTIETWNNGLEFAREVVKEARKVGALPILILEDEEAYLSGLKNTPKESLGKMGKHEYNLLSLTDAYVFIPGPPIYTYAPMVSREEGSAATSYNSSWYEAAGNAGVRGVRLTFGYVGQDVAKLLGKKRDEIVRRHLRASLLDANVVHDSGDPILGLLNDGVEAKLETGGNSLLLRLNGDTGIEDGIADEADVATKNNISYIVPGMIWKEVDSTTAFGSVKISGALTRLGLVGESTLEFENGKLVRWSSKNKSTQQKLDTIVGGLSPEKRVLSMVTIGLNPLLPYGYAQDRFVLGSLGLSGFGFTGIVKYATLKIRDHSIIEKGKLVSTKSSSG
jgi:leucyl aminopeptidase (aminopeptidase T)